MEFHIGSMQFILLTALFNNTWTLNFKSQLTIIFLCFLPLSMIIYYNNKQLTSKHRKLTKGIENSPITNDKLWPFKLVEAKVCFPKGPLRWLMMTVNKMIDGSKEQKHQLAFELWSFCEKHSYLIHLWASVRLKFSICRCEHDLIGKIWQAWQKWDF